MIPVVRVLAPNPGPFTLQGTNTWVVGRDPGVVIDPGPDDAAHLREVQREAGTVAAILVTHDHPDHAPGAEPLAGNTGAPVFAARPGGSAGGRPLRDGEALRFGGVGLRAVATPGHTPDHFAFHLTGDGALFTGDAVLGAGTSIVDPPEGDLALYLKSLERMQALPIRTIYPGHGPTVFDPLAKLQEYLVHRAERESQIVSALEGGSRGITELVALIYADVPVQMHPAAARQVLAHLIKLDAEGLVARSRSTEDPAYTLVTGGACRRCGRAAARASSLCRQCSISMLQEDP